MNVFIWEKSLVFLPDYALTSGSGSDINLKTSSDSMLSILDIQSLRLSFWTVQAKDDVMSFWMASVPGVLPGIKKSSFLISARPQGVHTKLCFSGSLSKARGKHMPSWTLCWLPRLNPLGKLTSRKLLILSSSLEPRCQHDVIPVT